MLVLYLKFVSLHSVSPINPQQCLSAGNNARAKRLGYTPMRNQVFYYVTANKIGSVFSSSKVQAHKHYSVNPAWVTSLLEASPVSCMSVSSFVLVWVFGPSLCSWGTEEVGESKRPSLTEQLIAISVRSRCRWLLFLSPQAGKITSATANLDYANCVRGSSANLAN